MFGILSRTAGTGSYSKRPGRSPRQTADFHLRAGRMRCSMKRKLCHAACRAAPEYAHAVVHGHLLIRGIQVRIVAARFGHAGLGVIWDDQLRNTLIELESPHMCADPACQLLVAGGLSVGTELAPSTATNRCACCTAPPLASWSGSWYPPNRQTVLARPYAPGAALHLACGVALVQLAETGVAIAVGLACRYSSQSNCWVRCGCTCRCW